MITLPLRFSTLKAMALSPAHFRHACTHEIEPSRAMRVGTAVHATLLGGSPIKVYSGTRRGKAWEEFRATVGSDTTIVTEDEFSDAVCCVEAVLTDPVARPLMIGEGINERRIDWSFRGVPFRSTPDRVIDGTLIELKTARSAEPGAFQRDAMRRHYHAQLAVYREALASQGIEVKRCVIVAVETVAPYCVSVHELDESVLELGYQSAVSWLERYQVCAASDVWPGYSQAPVPWRFEADPELDFSGVDDAEEAAQ